MNVPNVSLAAAYHHASRGLWRDRPTGAASNNAQARLQGELSPLLQSILLESPPLVRLALASGGDVQERTLYGWSPLHLAVHLYARRSRHFQSTLSMDAIITLLLERGADPTARDTRTHMPVALGEGVAPQSLRDAMARLTETGLFADPEEGPRRDPSRTYRVS